MSISTLEDMVSVRLLKAMDDLSDRKIRAEISAIQDFQKACNTGDANALVSFAPLVRDSSASPDADGAYVPWENRPLRSQTLAEVMTESLDYRDGPSLTEALQLLLNASNGANVQEQARGLIDRMATTWAKFNTEVEA